ncbi:hypothetical protein KRR55_06155 [Paeniglutamicibacter sp. ABSL32-1]|uniref:hypothetical protein n=1 Tax=Paeniglutamicibacter quisquiliarum TaxID=2849498 RepID=UPI001C2CDC30|nr:hypothetical protein [Paeniglutamicibacter quisquiliarum]MBV1778695.1 hypothetical protein [Paeniglutamicibacter quisquiliarum]
MLAQILPGFRDFRTPLVTGALWLILIWLLFGMPVPSKEISTGPMGLMNSLGDYLTPTALLGVVSFTAYVIGIVLALDSNQATAIVGRFMHRRTLVSLEALLDDSIRSAKQNNKDWRRIYWTFLEKIPEEYIPLTNVVGDQENIRVQDEMITTALKEILPRIERGIEREIPNLGNKLLHTNKELYDVFDRARSEADFRLGIAPPILAIAVYQSIVTFSSGAGLTGFAVLLGGILISTVLLVKGWNKVEESTATVLSMVQIGVIKSDTLEQLDRIDSMSI